MEFLRFVLVIFLCVSSDVTQSEGCTCFHDNFEEGASSFFNSMCYDDYETFNFERYTSTGIANPLGSDYFMTIAPGTRNCLKKDYDLRLNKGNEIIVQYYTSNNGLRRPYCTVNYLGQIRDGVKMFIDNERGWRNVTIKIMDSGTFNVEIFCPVMNDGENFAVGNIWIMAETESGCSRHSSPGYSRFPFDLTDCFADNFKNGASLILKNSCQDNRKPFAYRKYNDDLKNEYGSDFYLTAVSGQENCLISDELTLNADYKVSVSYYTSKKGKSNWSCAIYYPGSKNAHTMMISNDNRWKNSTILLYNPGTVQIRLNCSTMDEDDFIAIGNVWIESWHEDNCSFNKSLINDTSKIEDKITCLADDMENGKSIIFDQLCEPQTVPFAFNKYSQSNVTNQFGFEYFMTTFEDEINCLTSKWIDFKPDTEIIFNYRLSTESDENRCDLHFINRDHDLHFKYNLHDAWKNATLTVDKSGIQRMILNCDFTSGKGSFDVSRVIVQSRIKNECPIMVSSVGRSARSEI